jgi:hypothetical protein
MYTDYTVSGAAEDIVAYFRRYIDIHFEVVRRRQQEVT